MAEHRTARRTRTAGFSTSACKRLHQGFFAQHVTAVVMLAALALVGSQTCFARVKDYQVNRLLLFKSSCKVDTLEDRSGPSGPLSYLALCQNSTFYPDGVVVICSDRDDERSCEIKTQPREFRYLDSMMRR